MHFSRDGRSAPKGRDRGNFVCLADAVDFGCFVFEVVGVRRQFAARRGTPRTGVRIPIVERRSRSSSSHPRTGFEERLRQNPGLIAVETESVCVVGPVGDGVLREFAGEMSGPNSPLKEIDTLRSALEIASAPSPSSVFVLNCTLLGTPEHFDIL